MPQVSVIIPTYRHAGTVLESLDSVFAQSFADCEIIVINDGSPDDTRERLRPLAQAGRIRYFEQTNAGQAAARNRGLAEARGEFVAYLDDDDLWPADKLEWQLTWLRDRGADAVVGNVSYIGGCAFVPTLAMEGEVLGAYSFFSVNPIVSPGQVMIRKSILHQAGAWDETFRGSDDLDLWFRLARVTPLWAVGRIALHYRLHANNASNDIVAMTNNVWAVLEKQLVDLSPEERLVYRTKALHFLQEYSEAGLIAIIKSALWRRQFSVAGHAFRALTPILSNVCGDAKLAKRFLYDCAPSLGYKVAKRLGFSR